MTQHEFKFMHTPGPWKIKGPTSKTVEVGPVIHCAGDYAIISNGQIIAEVFHQTDKSVFQPARDHAILIAAAPRMFEALGRLEATVSDLLDRNCITDDFDATYADAAEARHAIAKATGKDR